MGEKPKVIVPDSSKPAEGKPFQVTYISKAQLSDIKGCHGNMDQVSALMTVCREEFQLQPSFDTEDKGAEYQQRIRFLTSCKFGQQLIATCCGQNKKESKALVAKLALFKVAPNIYTGIFGDEAPPDDLVKSAEQ